MESGTETGMDKGKGRVAMSDLTLAIETTGLGKTFGAVTAVENLNLAVPRGCIYGFLGPNGAGKTTTIKMLLGLLRPTAGKAVVLGRDAAVEGEAIRERVGYVAELQAMYDYMTIEEIVRFCRGAYPRWDDVVVRRYLDLFELPRQRRIKQLSKGMRTLLALVLALGPIPELLLLDEPTSGFDPIKRNQFLTTIIREIADGERTVFFSSHILGEVERVSDHVGILSGGQLAVAAPLDDLKRDHKRVRIGFIGTDRGNPAGESVERALVAIPGVRAVRREGRGFLLTLAGDVGGVLDRLRVFPGLTYDVIDMTLEEVFLDYADGTAYGSVGGEVI